LLASHGRAVLTALALALRAQPCARLFSGRVLFVGGSAAPVVLSGRTPAGSLEEIALGTVSAFWQPCFARTAVPDDGLACADERFRTLAREAIGLSVTCILGTAGRLQQLLEQLRQLTGRERFTDVWPGLAAVICGYDHSGAPDIADVGPVPILRVCHRPEGTLAVEDPRHGLLRLLIDHDLYYEFVPVEALDTAEPVRHSAAEVEPGVRYEVALTSPAGLWATLLGWRVLFESRQPLLLRVEAPAEEPVPLRLDAAAITPQRPHPRSAGTLAARPEMSFHSPWSASADRG
jgi:hypothetical protein